MPPQLSVGQRVRIYIDAPGDEPAEGTVEVIQDKTGKRIGVRLDAYHPHAHNLDGALPERGYGWWTLPERVQVIGGP